MIRCFKLYSHDRQLTSREPVFRFLETMNMLMFLSVDMFPPCPRVIDSPSPVITDRSSIGFLPKIRQPIGCRQKYLIAPQSARIRGNDDLVVNDVRRHQTRPAGNVKMVSCSVEQGWSHHSFLSSNHLVPAGITAKTMHSYSVPTDSCFLR